MDHNDKYSEKKIIELPAHLEWFDKFKINPIKLLLEESMDNNILYILNKIVLRLDSQNKQLIFRKKRLNETPERVRLLVKLESDEAEVRHDTNSSDDMKLQVLMGMNADLSKAWDYSCHKRMKAVQNAIIHILKHQNADGSFPFPLHITAYFLETLLKYDFEGNQFVEKGIRWLIRQQNADGGWGDANGISDVWATLKVLSACSFHSIMRKRPKVLKGAEFVLENYLSENKGGILEGMNAWDNLSYAYDGIKAFRGGTLRVLEVLARYDYFAYDKRVKKMLDWLEAQQLKDGYWPGLARLSSDKNEMVTLRVIRIFQLFFLQSGSKRTIKTYRIKGGGRVSSKKPKFLNETDKDLQEGDNDAQ